jgi:hypothetical protein
MPKVTLYVKDEQLRTWDRARQASADAGVSLSTFVSEALEQALGLRDRQLADEAARPHQLEPVELQLRGALNDSRLQTIRFSGACIARDESQSIRIFTTKGGKFILHFDHPVEGSTYKVYDSLEKLREDYRDVMDEQLLNDAFAAMGKPFVIEIE